MHPGDLAGQSVVVTGAAGELGSTIARRLLHQGAVVVCVDRYAEALDKLDRRSKRLALTKDGRALLCAAVPVWKRTHAKLAAALPRGGNALRRDLQALR